MPMRARRLAVTANTRRDATSDGDVRADETSPFASSRSSVAYTEPMVIVASRHRLELAAHVHAIRVVAPADDGEHDLLFERAKQDGLQVRVVLGFMRTTPAARQPDR